MRRHSLHNYGTVLVSAAALSAATALSSTTVHLSATTSKTPSPKYSSRNLLFTPQPCNCAPQSEPAAQAALTSPVSRASLPLRATERVSGLIWPETDHARQVAHHPATSTPTVEPALPATPMQGDSTARPSRQQRAIVPPFLLASETPPRTSIDTIADESDPSE